MQQVAIVDTTTGFSVERRDMKADGILMHRERKVIAVRAPQGDNATVIQVSISFQSTAQKRLTQTKYKSTLI